jgi:hypothetical protein
MVHDYDLKMGKGPILNNFTNDQQIQENAQYH